MSKIRRIVCQSLSSDKCFRECYQPGAKYHGIQFRNKCRLPCIYRRGLEGYWCQQRGTGRPSCFICGCSMPICRKHTEIYCIFPIVVHIGFGNVTVKWIKPQLIKSTDVYFFMLFNSQYYCEKVLYVGKTNDEMIKDIKNKLTGNCDSEGFQHELNYIIQFTTYMGKTYYLYSAMITHDNYVSTISKTTLPSSGKCFYDCAISTKNYYGVRSYLSGFILSGSTQNIYETKVIHSCSILSNVEQICISGLEVKPTANTVEVTWKHASSYYQGYIIIIHSMEDDLCIDSVVLGKIKPAEYAAEIRSFYLYCQKYSHSMQINFKYKFRDLLSIYKHRVYILETYSYEKISFITYSDWYTKKSHSCYYDCHVKGKKYFGFRHVTKTFMRCKHWSLAWDHYYQDLRHDYCRGETPWCHIMIGGWDHCNVPKCASIKDMRAVQCSDIKIIITGFYSLMLTWTRPRTYKTSESSIPTRFLIFFLEPRIKGNRFCIATAMLAYYKAQRRYWRMRNYVQFYSLYGICYREYNYFERMAEVFSYGRLKSGKTYTIRIVAILNTHTYAYIKTTTVTMGECFFDCRLGKYYTGIRSATKSGSKCEFWSRYSKYSHRTSNMCYPHGKKAKCISDGRLEECAVPSCNDIPKTDFCSVHLNQKQMYDSIMGSWKNDSKTMYIGFVALLFNEHHKCEQSIIFGKVKPNEYQIEIRSFYISCVYKRTYIKTITYAYKFDNVKPRSYYRVFLFGTLSLADISRIQIIHFKSRKFKLFYEIEGDRDIIVKTNLIHGDICININILANISVFMKFYNKKGDIIKLKKFNNRLHVIYNNNQWKTNLIFKRNVTYKLCIKFVGKKIQLKLGSKVKSLSILTKSFPPIREIRLGDELNSRKAIIGYFYHLTLNGKNKRLSKGISAIYYKYPDQCGTCVNSKCKYHNDVEMSCHCNKFYHYFNKSHCIISICTNNICENNGTCLIDKYKHCLCHKPYTGLYCGCKPNYCYNKGICKQNKDRELYCVCSIGYYGKLCQCKNEFCHNNGKCLESGRENLRCKCKKGFRGSRCICGPNTCFNGGYCSEINGTSFRCACKTGFKGRHCTCHPGFCKYGNCIGSNISPKCECFPSFSGKTCMCSNKYCNNHGICQENNGKLSCKCHNNFQGKRCSCHLGYCSDVGRCHEYGSYRNCTCMSGYSGRSCKCYINTCVHGKCTEINEKFHCNCNKGYVGQRCSCPVGYCKNNSTCQNKDKPSCKCVSKDSWGETCVCTKAYCNFHGECYEKNKKATCKCYKGYYGDFCQCVPNYCQNKGTCIKNKQIQQCKCVNGYEANDCSCKSGYCNGGGKCQLKNKKFICKCFENYSGKYCRCRKTYCLNGGLCRFDETKNTMVCICKLPYTGRRCSCNPIYCINGICIDAKNDTNKYKCSCHRHYEGQKCEIKMSAWRIALPYVLITLKMIVVLVSILIIVIIYLALREKQNREKIIRRMQKIKSRCYDLKKTIWNYEFGHKKKIPSNKTIESPKMDELFNSIAKNAKPTFQSPTIEVGQVELKYFNPATQITDSENSTEEVILEQPNEHIEKKSNLKKESSPESDKTFSKRHIKFAPSTKSEKTIKKHTKEECHTS